MVVSLQGVVDTIRVFLPYLPSSVVQMVRTRTVDVDPGLAPSSSLTFPL